MNSAEIPKNEAQRLAALQDLDVLDTGPEAEFDALVRTAALVCGVPISLISLIDTQRQWFKANVGLPGASETPRDIAFCSHAILGEDIFVVPDATQDHRFFDNPLVLGKPDIRFYAGAPLRLSNGQHVGTLCVIDRKPRQLDTTQLEVLRNLAVAAVAALEGRQALRRVRQVMDEKDEIDVKFRTLADHSPIGVYYADPQGACTYTNERWQEIYGLNLQQSLGFGWTQTLHPDDRDAVFQAWTRTATEGVEFEMEFRIQCQHDGVRKVRSRARAVLGSEGASLGYVGSVEDVTEHFALLGQSTINQAQLQRLYESTPAMLHSVDSEGKLLAVSNLWLSKTGYTREEVLGRKSSDFLAAPSRELSTTVVMPSLFSNGYCDNVPYQMVTKSGQVLDVLMSAVVEHDVSGQGVRALKVLEDVTLRRQAERILHEERARLANIVEGTNFGTWEWNVPTGEVLFNERWAAMLGYSLAQLQPLSIGTWRQKCHSADLAKASIALEAHFCGQTDHYEAEIRMHHRSGGWVWVLARGRLMQRTDDGKPKRMYGTHEDITSRKKQEEAAKYNAMVLARTGQIAKVGGWEVNLLSGDVYWSEEACKVLGAPADFQPTMHDVNALLAPEAQQMVEATVRAAMAGHAEFDLELSALRRDGQRIWVHVAGEVFYENGQAQRLIGAVQDITQRAEQTRALTVATERVNLATQSGGIGIWEWNIEADTLVWDAQMCRLYGLPQTSDVGSYDLWVRHLHPQDAAAAQAALQDAVKDGDDFAIEFRIVWADSSVHHISASGRASKNSEGKAVHMVGTNLDVTQARQMAQDLADQHELLQVTLQSIGDAVITTDPRGHVMWLNPVAERLTGWMNAEAKGRPLAQVFHIVNEETRAITENPVETCFAQGKVVGLANHTVLISKDGAEFGIADSAAPIRNAQGEVLGVVLVFHDVTEQRRMSGEMSHRATHDALTGLANRAEFETRLRRVLLKSHEDGGENALLYIDLDQFKLVNDACGHAAGDQLLQQVSKLLLAAVRDRDTLARLGGDEFAVILEHCSSEQAKRVAQQICERMDDFRFVHDGKRFRIGASIGLVPVDKRWATTELILQAADTSCYAAKEAGRNRVHFWFDTDQAMRSRHGEMQWTTRIEKALDEDAFVLFAQRIDLIDTKANGLHAEVLIRMKGDNGELVPPGAFLPAAERFHLASRIDKWVLRHTLEWMQSLPALDVLENISINLSGQSVGDRAFHRWAMELFSQAGPAVCARACLEITETAAVTNMADAALFIEQVRAMGLRVALDDFGAGASSFGYLKNLTVDYLKIDGQFIRDLVEDPLDDAAVRCFIDVAKVVGVKTVAEFVDKPEILARLRTIGADYVQGYLLHKPEPIESVIARNAQTVPTV